MIREEAINTLETFLIAQGQPNLLSTSQGPWPNPLLFHSGLCPAPGEVSWAQVWTSQAAGKSQTTNSYPVASLKPRDAHSCGCLAQDRAGERAHMPFSEGSSA